ncbi:MAG: NUDIX domain-containing protein, partial [Candidatus Nanohaloarchaea archaeon]|nr:NUDIX domain-containing protein [Candidatus Nanohaloarchaea archaeon]
ERNGQYLLVERQRGDFTGYWGLPGGKIEHQEHPLQAAVREISEETGIQTRPLCHEGIISERLPAQQQHFLLHLCTLTPENDRIQSSEEGRAAWHPYKSLEKIDMVASDRKMITHLVDTGNTHATCVIDQENNSHRLESFKVQS